jgi:GH43 family beta-xylosidase
VTLAINEGPEVLEHRGTLNVIYSASWCGTGQYALGRLTVPARANLLDPATWQDAKSPVAVFQGDPARGVYGPGHGSFFTSPDGRESWMAYHATEDRRGCFTGGLRTTRAQPFTWNADGTPDFGTPVSLDADIPAPAGDGTIAVQPPLLTTEGRRGTARP